MKKRYLPFIIFTTLFLAFVLSNSSTVRVLFSSNEHIESLKGLNEEQLIARQFDPETNAHIELEKLIKQYLPNPDTYEHISSRYTKVEDQLSVYTEYSSVREEGTRVKADALVIYHLNGLLINLLKVD